VTCNVVCPGPTDTPLTRGISAANPELVDKLAKQIPCRRLGTPDDVAWAVVLFCSGAASYTTGQVLSVNGGITMP
jgi:2-hydroxycyclohexanecarboxyl-CoA dehydrogenase